MDWHFKGKEFAGGLTNLSVEKILLAKLCKCTKKLSSSAELNGREVKDHCRLRNLRESSFNMTRGGGMKILRGGSENF